MTLRAVEGSKASPKQRHFPSVEAGGLSKDFAAAGERWELLYFKVYASQLPVIEQALETAGLMLGTNKSRGYCLEMICGDFMAGAGLESQSPQTMLLLMCRLYELLPDQLKQAFSSHLKIPA